MTTHSLILSPHEVLAALRGELGLVVRPVKFQTLCLCSHPLSEHQEVAGHTVLGACGKFIPGARCPLGVPGDRLVCKEPFYIQDTHGQHRKDGLRWGSWSGLPTTISRDGTRIVYYKEGFDRCAPCWRSPATMPSWASRITLEVASVGVGRLGDLTETDANMAGDLDDLEPADVCATAKRYGLAMDDGRASFACAWDAKYAAKGLGWNTSPWVWKAAVRRTGG